MFFKFIHDFQRKWGQYTLYRIYHNFNENHLHTTYLLPTNNKYSVEKSL